MSIVSTLTGIVIPVFSSLWVLWGLILQNRPESISPHNDFNFFSPRILRWFCYSRRYHGISRGTTRLLQESPTHSCSLTGKGHPYVSNCLVVVWFHKALGNLKLEQVMIGQKPIFLFYAVSATLVSTLQSNLQGWPCVLFFWGLKCIWGGEFLNHWMCLGFRDFFCLHSHQTSWHFVILFYFLVFLIFVVWCMPMGASWEEILVKILSIFHTDAL